jgi:hypothetical protein
MTNISYADNLFDLFDAERGKPPEPPAPVIKTEPEKTIPVNKPKKKTKSKRPKLKPIQKNFTLIGTSLIGKRLTAYLVAPNGKQMIQRLRKNSLNKINGFSDYSLLEIKPRSIKILYPDKSPCVKSDEKKGVYCSKDQQTATLELKRGKPTKSKIKPKPKLTKKQLKKRNKADIEKRKKLYKNNKRKIIKDEDAPAGMKVLHTPFGDRLIPDN